MANFVLADEINRAPAKVQSALLEVMAERHVTIGGQTLPDVPDPFLVLATQNPIESEGVYPLPEAQRDRFLMKITVDYPTAAEEREIVYRMGVDPPHAEPGDHHRRAGPAAGRASRVFVHHAIVDYVVRLVLATRTPGEHGLPDVASGCAYGASPRASLGLIAAGAGAGAAPRPRLRAAAGRAGRRRRRAARTGWCCPTTRSPTAVPVGPRRPPGAADRAAAAGRAPVRSRATAHPPSGPTGSRDSGQQRRHGRARRAAAPERARVRDGARAFDERGRAAAAALELTVRHRLDGLLQGNYLGLVPGPGSEAGEARLYQPGDDVRRMDWPVTARTTEPHIRQTIADRELETWLVVDLSPSLDFGTARCEKRELVLAAVTAVAHLTGARRQPGRRGGRHRRATYRIPARGGLAACPAPGRADRRDAARAERAPARRLAEAARAAAPAAAAHAGWSR